MAPGAPTPVAPFSHAVEVDGWIFVTGQMPTYPDDDSRPLAPDVESQTVRVMENLKIVLGGLKLGLEHVICARVYITDFEVELPAHEQDLRELFPGRPAARADLHRRHGLARGAMVEIDLLAKR
jgi:2-iminobutanoate/2-iminopropanoate deaminase